MITPSPRDPTQTNVLDMLVSEILKKKFLPITTRQRLITNRMYNMILDFFGVDNNLKLRDICRF